MLQHRASGHRAQALALQPEAGDEPVDRRGEHVLVGGVRVGAVRPGERDAVAADDDGGTHLARPLRGGLRGWGLGGRGHGSSSFGIVPDGGRVTDTERT